MLLESVRASNFRNLSGAIEFREGLNVLFGENGQGKTNWLEAISVLASARSFRTPRLQDAVNFGGSTASVTGIVRESPTVIRELQVVVSNNVKTAFVNGKKEPMHDYLGQLDAVVFNSDELEIVRGQPEARRRFLDAGIVSLHPPFVRAFADHNRVIKQKNILLASAKDGNVDPSRLRDSLAPWNDQLAVLAAKIYRARMRFVDRINEALEKPLFGREELSIRYLSSLEGKGDLTDFEGLVRERLALRVDAEAAAGHSLVGIHRDDLEIRFDSHDIRKFGSAGQQRSALLLLQLASISVYHATRGEYPLFLIDDIDAELDYRRIGRLLEYLGGRCQTIATTSKESFLSRFGQGSNILVVADGKAESFGERARTA